MRKNVLQGAHAADDDDEEVGLHRSVVRACMRVVRRHPRDALLALLAAAALSAIFVNALFLQPGPHPAPIFTLRPVSVQTPSPEPTGALAVLPRPRPAELQAGRAEPGMVRSEPPPRMEPAARPEPVAPRTRGEIIADIQRELARRGYYDGGLDGLYGAKTDAALRDFERAAGLSLGAEPSEALLQSISRSPAKGRAAPAAVANAAPPASAAQPPARSNLPPPSMTAPSSSDLAAPSTGIPTSSTNAAGSGTSIASLGMKPVAANDQPAGLVLPPQKVMAVQRALGDYGYGQVKPTGVYDPATRAAIEAFEGAHKLPVTGQITDRLMRELSKMTGRPVD